jgi:UDP-N-acetylmuramate dehydrogenase
MFSCGVTAMQESPLQHTVSLLQQAHMVHSNVSLADKNWFRTGGVAEWYAEPASAQDLAQLVMAATVAHIPVTLLGEGANILISDEGIKGLVLRPALQYISHAHIDDQNLYVTAGAGVPFHALIEYCLEHNALGLEEFSGIPGTVGGSVFINIHYFQWLLSQFLVAATVVEVATGTISIVDNTWFAFGYNHSMLHTKKHILADATFCVRKVSDIECAYARGRHDEIKRHRAQRYPTQRTCGSFFRNFSSSEVTEVSNGKLMIYVAYYLDKLGIKGQLTSGKAIVSHQHANMIVTQEGATSTDIINLARMMQERMLEAFNIIPQPECQLLGFSKYPLL